MRKVRARAQDSTQWALVLPCETEILNEPSHPRPTRCTETRKNVEKLTLSTDDGQHDTPIGHSWWTQHQYEMSIRRTGLLLDRRVENLTVDYMPSSQPMPIA